MHSPLSLYASLISPSKSLKYILPSSANAVPRKAYVHVVQTSGYNPQEATGAQVTISGAGDSVVLREGDGVYITGDEGQLLTVENTGDRTAEVLLFDVE